MSLLASKLTYSVVYKIICDNSLSENSKIKSKITRDGAKIIQDAATQLIQLVASEAQLQAEKRGKKLITVNDINNALKELELSSLIVTDKEIKVKENYKKRITIY